MSEDEATGQKDPVTIDALRVQQRADRAFHDVAQFHLDEFARWRA